MIFQETLLGSQVITVNAIVKKKKKKNIYIYIYIAVRERLLVSYQKLPGMDTPEMPDLRKLCCMLQFY